MVILDYWMADMNGLKVAAGDSEAVAIIRGGGATVPMGNVYFGTGNDLAGAVGPVIVGASNSKTDHYFALIDYSNKGITKVLFLYVTNSAYDAPGALVCGPSPCGATALPPNGLVQSSGSSSGYSWISCSGS
jgi:hypothetical protein